MPFSQADDFQTGLGNWSNTGGDDFDWQQNNGGTPSTGTGPSGGQSGTGYVYVETSSPVANSQEAILLSNVVNASLYLLEIDFFVHAAGAAMDNGGFLRLDAWDGDSWEQVFIQNGQNGATADGLNWQAENVDLSSFTNTDFQLRFVAHVSDSGSAFQNDFAVDEVSISGPDRASEDQSGFQFREDSDDEADAPAVGEENENLVAGMVVAGSGWVQSEDHADFALAGVDIDIKLYIVAADLTPASNECLFQIRNPSGSAEYVSLFLLTDGRLGWFWSDGGAEQSMFSSSSIPLSSGSIGVSVYHDQDVGGADNQAFFGYSRDGVNFVGLGSDTLTGTSDVFSGVSSAIVYVGRRVDGFGFNGKVHWCNISDDSAQVDHLEMTDVGQGWEPGDASGDTGVSDGGFTWTLQGDAEIQGGLSVAEVIRARLQDNFGGNPIAGQYGIEWKYVSEPSSEYRFVRLAP